ncbi:MAG TPA: hypothetical protein VGG39_04590 [Polyangiaceae bacterium]|jgi:hypothetical protein
MKSTSVVAAAVLVLGGGLLACNGLLGIGAASLESDDGGTVDAGGGGLSCATYCATVMQNCTDENAEYLSADICNAMCPAFELGGAVADTADDTVGCRLFFAQQAAQTPATSCRMAGPLGGNHCGTNPCGPFCAQDIVYCNGRATDAGAVPVPYEGGVPGCLTSCQSYPYLTGDAGDTTSESGNTLNCRLWHLETAYTSNPFAVFHCPHTEQVSSTCF